ILARATADASPFRVPYVERFEQVRSEPDQDHRKRDWSGRGLVDERPANGDELGTIATTNRPP
ncbi:MAG TPA: hypothetical protein VIM20_04505, partial [Candidatus Limnocylindrales bacterium]